jgi:tetratricopeptide (TPR) repeat protein
MTRPDRLARPWVDFPPSRRFCVSAIVAALLFTVPGAAQAPRRASQPLQLAARAFIEGRYEDVDQLTDKLDARDPNVAALKARAAIARGRYAQAEAALRPIVSRAPASEAALVLGLLQQMLGRADAPAILERVAAGDAAGDTTDLARAARALRALGRFQQANAAYRDAAAAAPGDAAINSAWGELFLEKYNKPEAVKSFQAALEADGKYAPAFFGLAQAMADDNPPQAIEIARRALEIDPSYVDAHIFIARQAVDAGHHDEGRWALQKALAVNPSSLDAHAWLAAIAYVEDTEPEFEAEVARALAIAPNYGEVYRVAGELAAHNYRFDEAVVLTRKALTLQPKDPHALADLGVHLLRTGDEPGARAALESSFAIDPYNVVTFNLLGLMDRLEKFVTIRDGDVILRMDKDEAPVLQDYALALAHQALTTLAARYEFTPRGPILIEIFPRHDDFAVRNVGLPGMIGALGACFGRVVTMDSPKVPTPVKFQWEATLWHELAHVVTLQMSNQRVPRWLTEGISVYEEKRARPEWARQMDMEFAEILEHGQALKLHDLNAAFTDPKKISLAYYQASLLVEHLVTTFGDAGLRKLVRSFAGGIDTESALKTALNTNFDQLQTGFDQSLDRVFGPMRRALAADPAMPGTPGMPGMNNHALASMPLEKLRPYAAEHPRSFRAQMALGRALAKAGGPGDIDEAIQAFERAAGLIPSAQGKDSPHAEMAALALKKKDRARAIAELQALIAVDFDDVEAARQLAALMQEAGVVEPARVAPVYQRIVAIDPFDADAHRMLGRMAMQSNQPDIAAREFRAVLALGPVDQAAAHTDLAESYLKSGKRAEARKQTLAALEIAPTYERAQELLLKLTGGQP